MKGITVLSSKLTVNYHQEPDSLDTEDQLLELTTEDAGGGMYYVLKTERWAFEDPEELMEILKDFVKRVKSE
jgi:hypothetical protein